LLTGLLLCEDVLALFALAALEVFTLVLSWSTSVLYLRHLTPRHFLVTGQAITIVAFFCIGNSSTLFNVLLWYYLEATIFSGIFSLDK
jgi:hypothetical protein